MDGSNKASVAGIDGVGSATGDGQASVRQIEMTEAEAIDFDRIEIWSPSLRATLDDIVPHDISAVIAERSEDNPARGAVQINQTFLVSLS